MFSKLNGEVMHVDEIVVACVERLEYSQMVPQVAVGSSFDAVISTHSKSTSTLYVVNPHKADEGVRRDGLLEAFVCVLVQIMIKSITSMVSGIRRVERICRVIFWVWVSLRLSLGVGGAFSSVLCWYDRCKECCGRVVCGAFCFCCLSVNMIVYLWRVKRFWRVCIIDGWRLKN